ncbi:2-keto-4-pentenoate hydratase/2-oxohepta-3-ene-1,7-dioic acid hydratase in catechol pathway [Advenella incenata]|jgi:2-keto-4-pentenoate hydratase/2-oxohepta-3-ene-1,7-dioic acid hydratase in catechol pathway|uniref:2-keto-4-pentenoate hydratase/2-oxohepta-3-ene-1,7-dioic acid hydratase in catechol pathway n=1 Tax=Advenella incenata TaxID=267800 RepID=A0A4Q7VA41_9BURK|nr:fumarylacetoacetate hydrolase family protein [Advenella incenata]RZT91528.1 2-keto-4-pentenoate hydratase/2-oxohepta-3-ene-1,7-dioic acid hydratase in catechol pathway [Advenella incenata]
MKFATLKYQESSYPCLVDTDKNQFWPVSDLIADFSGDMNQLVSQYAALRDRLAPVVPGRDLAQATVLAPIPRPRRNLFCVGRNYHAHARELSDTVFRDSNKKADSWPIVFTKVPECVIGPGETVVLPGTISSQIDYEAELAIIIGTEGKNIPRENALAHVFGYTIVNDVTARDIQMRHQQWDLGKSFDTFCPMGPWIVTADELDANNTRVRCWVNEQLRQDAFTTDLIFDLPTLIETCSRGITLYPGDIIATGTPAGVGMGMTPPEYLRSADVVKIQIDGIGELSNPFG